MYSDTKAGGHYQRPPWALNGVAHLCVLAIFVFCCYIRKLSGLNTIYLLAHSLLCQKARTTRLSSLLRISEGQNQGVGRAEFLFWDLGKSLLPSFFLLAELSSLWLLDWGSYFLARCQPKAVLSFYGWFPFWSTKVSWFVKVITSAEIPFCHFITVF